MLLKYVQICTTLCQWKRCSCDINSKACTDYHWLVLTCICLALNDNCRKVDWLLKTIEILWHDQCPFKRLPSWFNHTIIKKLSSTYWLPPFIWFFFYIKFLNMNPTYNCKSILASVSNIHFNHSFICGLQSFSVFTMVKWDTWESFERFYIIRRQVQKKSSQVKSIWSVHE